MLNALIPKQFIHTVDTFVDIGAVYNSIIFEAARTVRPFVLCPFLLGLFGEMNDQEPPPSDQGVRSDYTTPPNHFLAPVVRTGICGRPNRPP